MVNNASGPVNISDLTVDGSLNGVLSVVGVFYQNTSGTVNRVATRNQSSGKAGGIAIWAEGGPSDPLVTIENSSVHDYADIGIEVETNSATPKLTAVIKGNELTTSKNAITVLAGIDILEGSSVTVTSKLLVDPGSAGILAEPFGSVGSISANTVVNGAKGIDTSSDSISVSSNKIFRSVTGIVLGTSIAAIQSNSITDSNVAIDFSCSANPNVHSNIITDAGTALNRVPSAVATSNRYFNVGTIRTGCP